jgi:2-polyprenyl-6-hydroxyphenyl methylase/3-demethylubiquinone-9 3-methyltransferase
MLKADPKEIENFAKDSSHWWDEKGPFAPLHRLNPVRLSYIRAQIDAHFGLDTKGLTPFKNLSIVDAGCGGGLVCEPMARLGATITGVDADENAIAVAAAHAEHSGLNITYHSGTTFDLVNEKKKFDVVLALEIAEHVPDVDAFVKSCADLCKPGGLIIVSTLNRTPKSFALGIIAAEYILRWVPRGTHNWKKFIRPSEMAKALGRQGFVVKNMSGLVFDPLAANDFRLSASDLDVNYFITAAR